MAVRDSILGFRLTPDTDAYDAKCLRQANSGTWQPTENCRPDFREEYGCYDHGKIRRSSILIDGRWSTAYYYA